LSTEIGYIIVYGLEVAVLYCKHFRTHPYEIMKWEFEESRVHISFFQVPCVQYVYLHAIMIVPSLYLTVVCYNNCFGQCL